MLISGEYTLKVPKQLLWDALNDPSFLAKCIQGCESLEKKSDTEFVGIVNSKIGPVSAKFSGSITLSDIKPPNSYIITGSGKGGVAGFAKGKASILLETVNNETKLTYNLEANVGGKIAQLGSRLITGTIKKHAEDFFNKMELNLLNTEKNILQKDTKLDVTETDSKTILDKETIKYKDNKSFWYWVVSITVILILLTVFIDKIS